MRPVALCVAAMMAVCWTSGARASIIPGGEQRSFTGVGSEFVDATEDGPGVTIFTIDVPASGIGADELTGFKEFFVELSHSWVGDLVMTLSHADPEGDVVTLLDRPGVPQSVFGNGDDLLGVYRFTDAGGWLMPEASAGPGAVVPPGLYTASGPGAFANFSNSTAQGVWVLQVIDHAPQDTGKLVSWGFTINTIPTAPTAGMAGLCALAGLRRRR